MLSLWWLVNMCFTILISVSTWEIVKTEKKTNFFLSNLHSTRVQTILRIKPCVNLLFFMQIVSARRYLRHEKGQVIEFQDHTHYDKKKKIMATRVPLKQNYKIDFYTKLHAHS